ncbi:MAG: thioredoxin domain-containing protein [Solirubrobacteraceae bacterium]|nr:thioredoxin domain-containing protein [Solirubrobacteraceae bacterium]
MSSRAEEKAARKAEREAAQAQQQAADQRRKRLSIVGGVLALAAIVVVVAIVVSQAGTDDSGPGGSAEGKAAAALLAGVPQDGIALGDPKAPLTIEEFVDYQCPYCGQYSREVFPQILEEYIKTGKARIVLRTLSFLGDDSVKAARFGNASGEQNLQWQFTEAFYAQQGKENTGYVTDDFLKGVAADAGVDYDKAAAAADGEPVTKLMTEADQAASKVGVDSTPSFAMGPTGGTLEKVDANPLDADAMKKTIDEQLAAAEGK